MNQSINQAESEGPGFGLEDVVYILFRYKWRILISTTLGLIVAALLLFARTPVYESQAKLLVRYVVDTSSIDSFDPQARTSTVGNDNAINTEIEILTSWDLALQVAEKLTTERLLPNAKGVATKQDAARMIAAGLRVGSVRGSKVIWVSYESNDAGLSSVVLSEVIRRYLEMHLEVHRPSGGFEYLTQQSDQMRLRLNQTDEQLKQLKSKAGIVSMEQTPLTLTARVAKGERELADVEAELAAERARLSEMQKSIAAAADVSTDEEIVPPTLDEIRKYKTVIAELDNLRRQRVEFSAKYTAESRQMRAHDDLIEQLERQRRALEQTAPGLLAGPAEAGSTKPAMELISIRSRVAALEARLEVLRKQAKDNQALVDRFTDGETQVAQLERRRQLEEENAKYFDVSLEKARIDETLNPAKIPNINVVQKPSPGMKKTSEATKHAGIAALVGLGIGLVGAFLKEMVLDKSVKRPADIIKRMRLPLTLNIPLMQARNGRDLRSGESESQLADSGSLSVAPWEKDHFIRPYCDAIRDRLELYLQLMTHKPKLLAVAGLSEGAGSSTLAAGLAAALSKTADGKVLFVDMNGSQTNLHPFLEGRPALTLDSAISVGRPIESAADNLYLATAELSANDADKPMLKRFYNLIPMMKGSDFDYIVFDLPPFAPLSATIGLAGFMDRTLLVVHAEEDQDADVKRIYDELAERNASVSIILNKTREKVPKWAA